MLKLESIQLLDSVSSWQEAIRKSSLPLLMGGYVTEKYPEEIIRQTEELGAYYIIKPAIALAHAAPTQGVNQRQMAALLLKRGVYFPKHAEPVRLLIILAASDTTSHLQALRELASVLMDEERLAKIFRSESSDELYKYLVPA